MLRPGSYFATPTQARLRKITIPGFRITPARFFLEFWAGELRAVLTGDFSNYLASCDPHSLGLEQFDLLSCAAIVAAGLPVGSYYTMAGYLGIVILVEEIADGACRAWTTDLLRDLGIRQHLSARDRSDDSMDALSESLWQDYFTFNTAPVSALVAKRA